MREVRQEPSDHLAVMNLPEVPNGPLNGTGSGITNPVHQKELRQNQIGLPVIQQTHTMPEEQSNLSDMKERINEPVRLQPEHNERSVPLSNGNVDAFNSCVPSETNLNYASCLETGSRIISGFKLQTFKWIPKGPANRIVLLLHGLHIHTRFELLGLHDREEGSLVGALLNRGLVVYTYDAPGHGRRVEGSHANLKSFEVHRDIAVEMIRSLLPGKVGAERLINTNI